MAGSPGVRRILSTESWIDIAVAVIALLLLGLASLVETSLATVSRGTLRELLEGRIGAHRVRSLVDRPQAVRSTMLLIEIICVLVTAIVLTQLFGRETERYGALIALGVGFVAIVLVCRVLPVSVLPVERSEESTWLHRLATGLSFIAIPFTLLTEGLTRLLALLFRRGQPEALEISESLEAGEHAEKPGNDLDIEEDEQEMISGILGLEDATAREIMVPRLDIVAVPEDMSIPEVVDITRRVGHSRIPVFRESIDAIVGVIYAKDLLRFVQEDLSSVKLLDLVRPAYFVPESKRVDELLHDLQQAKVHIAIVVDEYGGTAGLVTIEDILEEIVGEIQDEYDRETPLVERVSAEEAIVDGRISVDEIAEIFDTEFADGESGTVGGYVQKCLGRIPEAGESVRADGLMIEVQAVEHHRIRKLRVTRVPEGPDSDEQRQAGAA